MNSKLLLDSLNLLTAEEVDLSRLKRCEDGCPGMFKPANGEPCAHCGGYEQSYHSYYFCTKREETFEIDAIRMRVKCTCARATHPGTMGAWEEECTQCEEGHYVHTFLIKG